MVVVDFIRDYWQYISVVLVFLFEILILILKKRPKTLDDLEKALSDVYSMLPAFIISAESIGNGYEKKKKVIDIAFKTFKSILGRDLTDSEADLVKESISKQIEFILSTPQKKGVKNEK